MSMSFVMLQTNAFASSLPIRQQHLVAKIGTEPDARRFSIYVPQTNQPYQFSEMHGKINNDGPLCTYASFGPAGSDSSIYRVEVCKATRGTSLQGYAAYIAKQLIPMFSAGYGEPLKLITNKMITTPFGTTYYRAYSQYFKESRSLTNKIGAMHYIYPVYFFQTKGHYVVFMGQFSDVSTVNPLSIKKNMGAIQSGDIAIMKKMLTSFQII